MNNVFWGLKEDWWKQIYDGKYHQFGHEVFDKGLHQALEPESYNGIKAEPGFYNSIKNASKYASEQLGKTLTIDCYRKIHQLACEHFSQLNEKVINVSKENINNFRNANCSCFKSLKKSLDEHENETKLKTRNFEFFLFHAFRGHLYFKYHIQTETGCKKELNDLIPLENKESIINSFCDGDRGKAWCSRNGVDIKNVEELIHDLFKKGILIHEQAIESTEKVMEQLKVTQEKLNLSKPFASLKIDANGEEILIHINYNYKDPTEIEDIVCKLINASFG